MHWIYVSEDFNKNMSIRVLSKELQEVAEAELNEVPSQVQDNIQALKDWLSTQEHIKYREDDQLLLNFLRGSKFSLQRAKEKLDAYYTCRTLAPEISYHLDPNLPLLQIYLKVGFCIPLPLAKHEPAGPRVILIQYRQYDPDEITFSDILRGATMMCDILLNEDDNYVVSGMKIIWDLNDFELKTALQATLTVIRKMVYCYEKAFPVRMKSVFVVNIPKFFVKIANLTKGLLSKKLADRVHLYSTDNWEEAVYKDIPRSIMPNEYGGTAGPLRNLIDEWKDTTERHRQRLLDEDNYYTDESKRKQGLDGISDLFGVQGSFRKFEID